ncbi:hypothetical protein VST7929_02587 [Vibrio stylophorae]|uniref:Uncharacterized protein n=1 Tax=Vibrio stylophorae TaxID=659351 RepID=A0ABN8DX57_9VIBR|nr:hypothetical protein [Vibrio stylophorae]CAH0534637.1 hypothetical protein VST7929_02587 [Vibrio stylophorae]
MKTGWIAGLILSVATASSAFASQVTQQSDKMKELAILYSAHSLCQSLYLDMGDQQRAQVIGDSWEQFAPHYADIEHWPEQESKVFAIHINALSGQFLAESKESQKTFCGDFYKLAEGKS